MRTSNTHYSFCSLFSLGIVAGSRPSSSGSFPVATGRLLFNVSWLLPLSNRYFMQFSQPFQNILTYYFFFLHKVNLWLSLLSNTEHIYYLCIQSPLKCALSLFSILPVLNPLQQAERLPVLQHTNAFVHTALFLRQVPLLRFFSQCCLPDVFWNSRLHIHFFSFLNIACASSHLLCYLGVSNIICYIWLRTRLQSHWQPGTEVAPIWWTPQA